jgi:hypothetical protein
MQFNFFYALTLVGLVKPDCIYKNRDRIIISGRQDLITIQCKNYFFDECPGNYPQPELYDNDNCELKRSEVNSENGTISFYQCKEMAKSLELTAKAESIGWKCGSAP